MPTCKKLCIKIFYLVILLVSQSVSAEEFEPSSFWENYFTRKHIESVGEKSKEAVTFKRWFVGPIFTPTPITMDPRHPGIEPILIFQNIYGTYGNSFHLNSNCRNIWSIIQYVDAQIGFNKFLGFEIIAALSENFTNGAQCARFKDTYLRFGIQILNDIPHSWQPDFRILFQETLPTGSYQKLSPSLKGTDITGLDGSFKTGAHLAFQKGFLYRTDYYKMKLRWSTGYFLPSRANVKGQSIYGGSSKTNGKVYLRSVLSTYLAGEYSISQRCSIAFDSNYQKHFGGSFSGKKEGIINVSQLTFMNFAPEIQVSLTKRSGMVFGSWFSITGQNSFAFVSIFGSFLYIF